MGWLAQITGGRPMRYDGFAFTDIVSGRSVYRWIDRLGRCWLAEGAWSSFRVSANAQPVNNSNEKDKAK